jgi:hypothetical protein
MNINDSEKEYIKKILGKIANGPSIYDNMNTVEKIKQGLNNRKDISSWFNRGSIIARRELTTWNNN